MIQTESEDFQDNLPIPIPPAAPSIATTEVNLTSTSSFSFSTSCSSASSSSNSSLYTGTPNFVKNVQAVLKRNRVLGGQSETFYPRRPQFKKLEPSKPTTSALGSVGISKPVCNQVDNTPEDLSPTFMSSATESIPNTLYPKRSEVKQLEPSESTVATVEPIPNAFSSNSSDSVVKTDPNFPKLYPTCRPLKPGDISFSSTQEKLAGTITTCLDLGPKSITSVSCDKGPEPLIPSRLISSECCSEKKFLPFSACEVGSLCQDDNGNKVNPKIGGVPSHATSLVLAEEQSLCKIVPTNDEVRKLQTSHQSQMSEINLDVFLVQKILEPRYETHPMDPNNVQCSKMGSTYMAITPLLSDPVFQSNASVTDPRSTNPTQGPVSSSGSSSEPQGVTCLDGQETSEKEAKPSYSKISHIDESTRSQATQVDCKISHNAVPPVKGSSSIMDIDSSKSSGAEKVPRRKKYNPDLYFKVNGKMYQKLDKTGSGGSSEVYKVITSDCTIYALKRIKLKGRDYPTAYGFCQEIEYLNKLKGRNNIIQLIDYEVTDKALFQEVVSGSMSMKDGKIKAEHFIYMVLEYGEIDLAHMLSHTLRETENSCWNIKQNWIRFYWQQMLQAVNTIHEERIVHSDLKPANFLLVKGTLKLIDFGIAKAIMSDTTNIQRDGQVGTLNYMSPEAFMFSEQNANESTIKCGRASDIWSLGCILYQMVYGKTPFSEYKTFWSKFKVITDRNHVISYDESKANSCLVHLIKKCLAWDKDKRWRIPQLLQHPFLNPPLPQFE